MNDDRYDDLCKRLAAWEARLSVFGFIVWLYLSVILGLLLVLLSISFP